MGYKEMLIEYEGNYKLKHNIPNKFHIITCIDFDNFVEYKKMIARIWVENNFIYMVSNDNCSNKDKIKICLDKIVSFKRIGDNYSYSNVTGASSGETSIKGAIIGGVLAGGAGAIIGSRKKGEPIKTEHVIVDNRTTILLINVDGKNYNVKFDSNAYDVFMRLIPHKEESTDKSIVNNCNEKSVFEQLEELGKLKAMNIITEEEFLDKKKVLLSKIK